MKKQIIFSFCLICAMIAHADNVQVSFVDGISDMRLKSKMEKTLCAMFTEINDAAEANRNLDFQKMGVDNYVSNQMAMIWENAHFVCIETKIAEHCITIPTGYQIRNIPLKMKPAAEDNFNEDEYQEAVVTFDRQGRVQSFHMAINRHQYTNIVKNYVDVTDLRCRQLILEYLEQFRTAYVQKDIDFIEQVFSEDALIITGRVVKVKMERNTYEDITYTRKDKQQYIKDLKNVFKNAKSIEVTFDSIGITRHPTHPNYYGVTLHQYYNKKGYSQSGDYSDDGYLFLLWDFRNEDAPEIYVRAWQPYLLNGKPLPQSKILNLGSKEFIRLGDTINE